MSVALPFRLGELSFLIQYCAWLTGPQETTIFSYCILWRRSPVFVAAQDDPACARNSGRCSPRSCTCEEHLFFLYCRSGYSEYLKYTFVIRKKASMKLVTDSARANIPWICGVNDETTGIT